MERQMLPRGRMSAAGVGALELVRGPVRLRQDVGDIDGREGRRHIVGFVLPLQPLALFHIQLVTDILRNIIVALQIVALLHECDEALRCSVLNL